MIIYIIFTYFLFVWWTIWLFINSVSGLNEKTSLIIWIAIALLFFLSLGIDEKKKPVWKIQLFIITIREFIKDLIKHFFVLFLWISFFTSILSVIGFFLVLLFNSNYDDNIILYIGFISLFINMILYINKSHIYVLLNKNK